MKQAASRPRPPFPSAASGSMSSSAARSTPSEASALPDPPVHREIVQGVAQQPPDQELEAEIIDPLGAGGVRHAGRFHPSIDDIVAHRQDRRGKPVVRAGSFRVLADPVDERIDDRIGEVGGGQPGQAERGTRNGRV